MIPFLAAALSLSLYVGIPSTLWNFDGVACAAALELGQPAYFFHSNHLFYAFFGYFFWKWLALPCGITRALPALQLFTSLCAAAGLAGLFRVLRFLLKKDIPTLLLTLGLSVTAAFWVWSIEAQVYALGFLALAWATYFLIAYPGSDKYIWVGLLHAGAILGHVLHVLWVIPALYWMWGDRKAIQKYLAFASLGTAIPYVMVLAFVIAPGRSLARILIWLKGSAALTPDRSWAWHFPGPTGPWLWLKSTAPALWGSFWPYQNTSLSTEMWMVAVVSILIMTALVLRGGWQKPDKVVRFGWLWLGVYGLFLSTWEPTTYCYRMTDVIPLGLLMALGLKSFEPKLQWILSMVFLGTTLTLNAATRALPMHDATLNEVYQDTLSLSKITPADSLYITPGGVPWIYLLYFTGRTAWNANSLDSKRLAEAIHKQKREHPVYVLEGQKWRKVP